MYVSEDKNKINNIPELYQCIGLMVLASINFPYISHQTSACSDFPTQTIYGIVQAFIQTKFPAGLDLV